MIENKAIATRESYGNALVEIANEHDDLVVLDADLAEATLPAMAASTSAMTSSGKRMVLFVVCGVRGI